jgi:hypothetical protein
MDLAVDRGHPFRIWKITFWVCSAIIGMIDVSRVLLKRCDKRSETQRHMTPPPSITLTDGRHFTKDELKAIITKYPTDKQNRHATAPVGIVQGRRTLVLLLPKALYEVW